MIFLLSLVTQLKVSTEGFNLKSRSRNPIDSDSPENKLHIFELNHFVLFDPPCLRDGVPV